MPFIEHSTANNIQIKFKLTEYVPINLSTYLLTPVLPNVLVLDISGRIQALFRRCSGCLIQSSQYLLK